MDVAWSDLSEDHRRAVLEALDAEVSRSLRHGRQLSVLYLDVDLLKEINDAAPDTPVFILRLYDRALLNRAALRAVGFTKDTQPPPGSEIAIAAGVTDGTLRVTVSAPATPPVRAVVFIVMIPFPPRPWSRYSSNIVRFPRPFSPATSNIESLLTSAAATTKSSFSGRIPQTPTVSRP